MTERQDDLPPPRPPAPEPLFNAPAVSLALLALLAIAYGIQVFLLTPDEVFAGALSGQALAEGRWSTLVSHIFLHAGLVHLLMNSGAALAFGPAVARHFGPGARAASVFMLFFLVCGVVGGLGFVALHPDGAAPVVGASGAISGLWGAASRMIRRSEGLWGVWEGPVRGQVAAVVILNLLIGLTGYAAGGLPIAWEAHIAGFAAGLLLIGPFTRLARSSDPAKR